jgi:hypothetical protein
MDSPNVTPAFSGTLFSVTPSKLTGAEECSDAVHIVAGEHRFCGKELKRKLEQGPVDHEVEFKRTENLVRDNWKSVEVPQHKAGSV